MIRNFNQFINESLNQKNQLSVHETINEPFAEFIDNAQEKFNEFISRIGKILHDMDIAIETTKEELADVLVGEPTITVDNSLSDINVTFHTNIPNNDEAWEADESPALELERRLDDIHRHSEVQAEIYYKPDEDGNCIVKLEMNVIDTKNFGEYTDVLTKLGE